MKLDKQDIIDIIRSSIISLLLSCIMIFIFAIILTFSELNESWIMPGNIICKMIALLFGCMFGIKSLQKGLFKGFTIGVVFAIIVYLVYSIVNNDFKLTTFTIYDIIANIVAATISSIIMVNFKKPKIA